MKRQYWKFYWPLALTGMVMLLARQFQNGTLSRYPNAARQLATFAFASGMLMPFMSALGFLPQMANVFGRSCTARRRCLRFTFMLCAALAAIPACIALVPGAEIVPARIFGIADEQLAVVILYLRLLTPMLFVQGLKQYYTGLLVQAKRTGLVTVLHGSALALMGSLLAVGLHRGWQPVVTLAASQICAGLLHLALLFGFARRGGAGIQEPETKHLTYLDMARFFWPVALTSLMFALSRPIIYSYVNRTPGAEPKIAALRVAFDLALIFHMPVNQLRHLFVTFGFKDMPGLRRFILLVLAGALGIMLLVALSPLSMLVLRDLLGVRGAVLPMARQVLLTVCLIPVLVAVRNYFHGRAMVSRTTVSMGLGATLRVAAIWLASWAGYATGMLNHTLAALILTLGFAVETLTVALVGRRQRHVCSL